MAAADLVKAYYGLFSRPARDILDAVVHPDFELDDAPLNWHLRGKEAVWKAVDRPALLEPGEFVCDAYFGDEDAGAMHWTWDVSPKFAATFSVTPPDGRARVEGVALVTFRDGKLKSLKEHWDSASLLRQFGVSLPEARMG